MDRGAQRRAVALRQKNAGPEAGAVSPRNDATRDAYFAAFAPCPASAFAPSPFAFPGLAFLT